MVVGRGFQPRARNSELSKASFNTIYGLTVRMEPKEAMTSFIAPAISEKVTPRSGNTGALECIAIDLQAPH